MTQDVCAELHLMTLRRLCGRYASVGKEHDACIGVHGVDLQVAV